MPASATGADAAIPAAVIRLPRIAVQILDELRVISGFAEPHSEDLRIYTQDMSHAGEPRYHPGNQPAHLRASDADREVVSSMVRKALDEGRLDLSELDERLGAVYEAKTHGDLAAVVEDIVPTPKTPQPAPRQVQLYRTPGAPVVPSDRLILPAVILGITPFGIFGAHRFYTGDAKGAAIMLLCTLSGIGVLYSLPRWLIDLILLATANFRDGNGKRMIDWI